MNLKIKLNNPKYCAGCPKLFGGIVEDFTECWYYNQKLKIKKCLRRSRFTKQYSWAFKAIRPQKCIKENGE